MSAYDSYADAAGNVYVASQVSCVDADGNSGPCSIFPQSIPSGTVYDDYGATLVSLVVADPRLYSKYNSLLGDTISGRVDLSPADFYAQYGVDAQSYDDYAMNYLETPAQRDAINAANRGGSFLDSVGRWVALATVGSVGFGVGAASGANLAVNVAEGDPLTRNAALAGGADIAGLAAGAAIAGSGIVAGEGAVTVNAADAIASPEVAEIFGAETTAAPAELAGAVVPGSASGVGATTIAADAGVAAGSAAVPVAATTVAATPSLASLAAGAVKAVSETALGAAVKSLVSPKPAIAPAPAPAQAAPVAAAPSLNVPILVALGVAAKVLFFS